MEIKRNIKKWLATRIKNLLLEYKEKLPVLITSSSCCVAGKETYHNGNFEIKGKGKVKIGSYCAFGNNIKLILSNHDYRYPVMQYTFYHKQFGNLPDNDVANRVFSVEIGSDVWIGDNVIILANVKIGDGVVIGAGSIVSKDIEPYTIVGGVPAKPIKKRFSDENIKILLEQQWWNWSEEEIKNSKDFFFKKLE